LTPLNNEFWLERWQQNQIGFHQPDINPYLRRYWAECGLSAGTPVFVPFCGKSLDMNWLVAQGHPVLGVEVSPIAVEDFFRDLGVTPSVTRETPFSVYQAAEVRIMCGDFFDLTTQHLQGVGGVYDRASLVALPASMRRDYVEHLLEIMDSKVPIMLVTLDYPIQEMDGPPFSVSDAEVRNLFELRYSVEKLYTASVLDESPRFRQRGLTRLDESIYRLIYRP